MTETFNRAFDTTPNPTEYGFCSCCDKPLSEADWWMTQGHHCRDCWKHLDFSGESYFCSLHDKVPSHLKTDEEDIIQDIIDSKAYKNGGKP
jgi:hypothetical protein